MSPTFSVIVAVRNGAATIQRCIDSVPTQDAELVELVIVDGASDDGTVGILDGNGDRLAHWESESDDGISHAWNKALGHAQGEWLLFLGADDRMAADDTLVQARTLLADIGPEIGIAYGRVAITDEDGKVVGQAGVPWVEASVDFHRHNTIPHQAVFHRRSLIDQIGPFDQSFEILGDYELLIRAFKVHEPAFLDLTITEFAGGGLSERPDAIFRATREAYRARFINDLERWPVAIAPRVLRARAFDVVRRVAGQRTARAMADRYHERESR